MADPTYPTSDSWENEPSEMTAAARVAWQDRLLRGVCDQIIADINERANQHETVLTEVYRPLRQNITRTVGGTRRVLENIKRDYKSDAIMQRNQLQAKQNLILGEDFRGPPILQADPLPEPQPNDFGIDPYYPGTVPQPKPGGIVKPPIRPIPQPQEVLPNDPTIPKPVPQQIPGIPEQGVPEVPQEIEGNEVTESGTPNAGINPSQPPQSIGIQQPALQQPRPGQDPNEIPIPPPSVPAPSPEDAPVGTLTPPEYDPTYEPKPGDPKPFDWSPSQMTALQQGQWCQWYAVNAGPNDYPVTAFCGNFNDQFLAPPSPPPTCELEPPKSKAKSKIAIMELPAGAVAGSYFTCPGAITHQPDDTYLNEFGQCVDAPLQEGGGIEQSQESGCNPPPPPAPPLKPTDLVNWNDPNICSLVESYVTQSPNNPTFLESVIGGIVAPANDYQIPDWINNLIGMTPPQIQEPLAQGVSAIFQQIADPSMPMALNVGCDPFLSLGEGISRFFNGLINKISSDGLAPLIRAHDYLRNYGCANELPSQAGIDLLRIVGELDPTTWTCLTRALGHTPLWHEKIVEHSTVKPDPLQAVAAWRRQEERTEDEIQDTLKKLGVCYKKHRDQYIKITEALPGISDIARFLIRDVADDKDEKSVVQRFKLDDLFKEKYQGKLIKYAEAQGITEELAKYYWRAHWDLPSRVQVNEFFQRLRKDDDGKLRDPSQIEVKEDDVKALYAQNDVAPFWVDKYLATQYHVLGRIDIRRAYGLKVFGDVKGVAGFNVTDPLNPVPVGAAEKEVYERYRDMGFNKRDARVQALLTASIYDKTTNGVMRASAANLVCDSFATGAISEQESLNQLKELGEAEEVSKRRLKVCTAKNKLKILKAYITAIKRMYFLGEIEESEVINGLSGRGMAMDKINDYLALWRIERQAKAKRETHSMLCQQYAAGIITAAEMQDRLKILGYNKDVATRVVRTCVAGVTQRSQKEMAAANRMAAREAKAAANERLRQFEKQQKELEKQQKTRLTLRSESNLIKFWNEGVINEQFVRTTFQIRGYDNGDIERWIRANRPELTSPV